MMKRLALLLSLTLFATIPATASVQLLIDAGLLTDQNGNPISDGGSNPLNADLVLAIVSPSGVFTPTVGSQFVSGDNLILAGTGTVSGAFGVNDSSTTPGETINTITFNYLLGATGNTVTNQSTVVAGDKIAIRWYTNFTLGDFLAGETPTSGYYGTYTTTALLPDNEDGSPWVTPTDGSNLIGSAGSPAPGIFFYTSNDPLGGDQSPLLGEALTPVLSGEVAVPEPSTYALLATGLLFVAGMAVRKKRLAVVTK
jgi:hypothetical protein